MSQEFPLLQRLSAFTDRAEGGNPADVWIGEALPGPGEMVPIPDPAQSATAARG